MKVVVKKPNEPAVIISIKDTHTYEDLKTLIGGWIEIAVKAHGMFDKNDLVVYVDEEGLLKKLPLNFYRPTDQAPIVGIAVAVKTNPDGDDIDMTDVEAKSVAIMLDTWSRYSVNLDKEIN